MADVVYGARCLNRLCNSLAYSRGLILWTLFWIGFTSFMVMRHTSTQTLSYRAYHRQIWLEQRVAGNSIPQKKSWPSSMNKKHLPIHHDDMNSVSMTPAIADNEPNDNQVASGVSDLKTICSAQGRRGKETCVTLDLSSCQWLDTDTSNNTVLPLGKNMYILRNLTHLRNTSKLLPGDRKGAIYMANITSTSKTSEKTHNVIFIASYGDLDTRRMTETREKGVFLLNKILGLNQFPPAFSSRTAPVWTRGLIPPSRRGEKANSLRLSLYVIDKSPVLEMNDYNTYLVLLYLSKCALPVVFYSYETFIRTNYVLDSYSCFLSENQTDFISSKRLLSLKSYLTDKERLCKLPTRLIKLLREADDVTTKVPTIGQRLLKSFSNDSKSSFYLITSEEVDARVSDILYWYTENCVADKTQYVLQEPSRQFLQSAPLANATVIDRHNGSKVMLVAKFKNGVTAYFKQLHVCRSDYLGEGARELLAYYVDRALGLSRTPSIVVRQFYFKDTYPYAIYQDNSSTPIELNLSEAVFIKHFRRKIRLYDDGRKYMEFVFIGEIKDLARLSIRTDEVIELLFLKTIDGSSSHRSVTQQTLRDISSIIIYDFIIHNWDRMGDNWVRSALRNSPFDAGNAWYDIKDTAGLVCERIIQFPILPGDPAHLTHASKLDVPMLDRNVLASCNAVPVDYQLCRFDKDTVEKVKWHGKDIVNRMKDIIKKEDTGFVECMELDKHKIFQGIQERVDYLLKYFETCYQRLGDKMYL